MSLIPVLLCLYSTLTMSDPRLSEAKRKQRTQALTSNMAQASLERQLVAAQTAKTDLEAKLREKEVLIDRLEGDRRWLAEREEKEREEKEHERAEREEAKVSLCLTTLSHPRMRSSHPAQIGQRHPRPAELIHVPPGTICRYGGRALNS